MSDNKRHAIRRLTSYADEHRGRMYLAISFSILNKIFDLAPPVLIGAEGRHRR